MRHDTGASRCTPLPNFTSVASSSKCSSEFTPSTASTRRGALVSTAIPAASKRVTASEASPIV
jgi:hypothetical protein